MAFQFLPDFGETYVAKTPWNTDAYYACKRYGRYKRQT